jgi:hypothetical protein
MSSRRWRGMRAARTVDRRAVTATPSPALTRSAGGRLSLVVRVAVPRYRCIAAQCARVVLARTWADSRLRVRQRCAGVPGMYCGS